MPTWAMAPLPSNGKLAKMRPPSTLAMVGALSAVGLDLVARMSKYPTKRGTAEYKRTGTLGRGWTMTGPKIQGQDLVVFVGNKVNYTGPVQGLVAAPPKQSAVLRGLGWTSVEVVGEEVVAEHRPLILKSMQPR